MVRLNGLTKAAKKSALNSRMCGSCPFEKERKCTPEILRICFDSYVQGYKKGANFTAQTEKDINSVFNKEFGTDLNMRLKKLLEETKELIEAISEYEAGLDGIESVKDEMSDVLAVLTHVSGLIGTDNRRMLEIALDKVLKRKDNPNYKRTHPHTEY